VAAGDIDGNGRIDLVTGPGPGREPLVKVIDGTKLDQVDPEGEIRASALLADFLAYDQPFRGGVYVGTGNIKGFAFTDVLTGPGAGAPPLVKVFSKAATMGHQEGGAAVDLQLIDSFFAYPEPYRGGVRVSSLHEATSLPPFGSNRDAVVTTRATGDGTTPEVFSRAIPLP
jgi:fibronectin-binding autotransporter adhesin